MSRWKTNFLAGLAVVLPAIISVAIVLWLFGTVSNITDKLLLPVPGEWKYVSGNRGEIHWYWSLAALAIGLGLVTLVGAVARHYVGRKLIQMGEMLLLRVPLLNVIYSTIKQVKEAFAGNKSSFKEAVLVEFPQPGMYSLGFITGDQRNELQQKTPTRVWSVFVPTTPNPTTGFLLFLPESKMVRLDMSVADAIKSIISLGSITPEYAGGSVPPAAPPVPPAPPA